MADNKEQEEAPAPVVEKPELMPIPVEVVLTATDLRNFLRSGWQYLGVFTVGSVGGTVATLQNPNAGLGKPCHVWARLEPTMPLGLVLGILGEIVAGRLKPREAVEKLMGAGRGK